ncbi:MAG: hypothetical protein HFH36_03520 [Lachnospiraceae bacterium]|nr:hypothetical protein [Lachnospiraceae bacterium]
MTDITQVLDSMENALRLQIQAGADRRAAKAEREEDEFKEKLSRAAASKMELEGIAAKVKGSEESVRRDQMMALMMGGF